MVKNPSFRRHVCRCERSIRDSLKVVCLELRSLTCLVAPDFRERAAIFDHTVQGAFSPPHTSRAPGFATQDHAQARDSNAVQGNTQAMEATFANLLRKECRGCNETRRPSRPASRIQSSGAIVTSQPWIQLTGGVAPAIIANPSLARQVEADPYGWENDAWREISAELEDQHGGLATGLGGD